MEAVRIDVCVCTFRRPYVAETLRSLAKLELKPGWRVRVIVADNDDAPSARALAETVAKETSLSLSYIHAPSRNISVARNACLDAAEVPFLAFIDDDEIAAPGWLAALMSAMESSGADVVLGPVHAVYGADCPEWLRRADFHSTLPPASGGGLETGWAGNVLLRLSSPALQGLRFRKELGRTGGEDTIYFSSIYKAGGRIVFAPEALATEIVPRNRESFGWLLKRRFRSGQTHGLLLLEAGGGVKDVPKAALKAVFCAGAALANAGRWRFWILRGALHAGVAARLLGGRVLEQYGGA